jgi:ankyrin repeat protein
LSLTDPEPVSNAAQAIRSGDLEALRRLLREHPSLAVTPVGPRTLLHVATDWPGHFPNAAAAIRALVEAGADVNAPFTGAHRETPLHWAASTNDLAALEALLEAGADIEAHGAVIGGGTALADAVAFGQWEAARRLVERGARTTLWQAAALGLIERLREHLAAEPGAEEITNAFWCACLGGLGEAAELLRGRGADLHWIGYDRLTPLGAAERSGARELADWLLSLGAA